MDDDEDVSLAPRFRLKSCPRLIKRKWDPQSVEIGRQEKKTATRCAKARSGERLKLVTINGSHVHDAEEDDQPEPNCGSDCQRQRLSKSGQQIRFKSPTRRHKENRQEVT